jgi:hypothetical protein
MIASTSEGSATGVQVRKLGYATPTKPTNVPVVPGSVLSTAKNPNPVPVPVLGHDAVEG